MSDDAFLVVPPLTSRRGGLSLIGEKVTSDSVLQLYQYTYWAFGLTWECIMRLTDAQFTQPINYSMGSVRHHIVHVMSATQRWMKRLQRLELPARLVFEDYPTCLEAKEKWDEVEIDVFTYIRSLEQSQLDSFIHWELPARGLQAENRIWEILMHVANHATDHRSQILVMLHIYYGIETPEQDMLFYLLENSDDKS